MKLQAAVGIVVLSVVAVVVAAQDKAGVQMEKPGPFHAGGPIAFVVKLNEPLPKGARFDFPHLAGVDGRRNRIGFRRADKRFGQGVSRIWRTARGGSPR